MISPLRRPAEIAGMPEFMTRKLIRRLRQLFMAKKVLHVQINVVLFI